MHGKYRLSLGGEHSLQGYVQQTNFRMLRVKSKERENVEEGRLFSETIILGHP